MQIASGTVSQSKTYILQARTNSDGRITVRQDEVVIGQDKTVKAGEMFTQPAVLKDKSTFEIRFTPATGAETLTQTLTVEQSPK
ncbi:pectate disaccharide-lyase [Klebsiella michiganensis]|uniref:Pectate disaccharide-lyase n=1 Tax=Klebsiella michiganensis TaxID=1134687 RepID=A0A7H4M3A0_9ENTR|nr:pectate disaccharide-lyase [Klebsiella michiganensis]